jgi:glyoxylase-like metal-dependent hydrolase (beta-lactamase superfamily II)
MKTKQLGDALIHRIVEFEGFPITGELMFTGWKPETLIAAREWLDPRLMTPGGDNLIIGFHSFLVQAGGRNILVDGCNGNDKQRAPLDYATGLRTDYLDGLTRLGLAPEDIDVVLCTHLHFDHVGWNTRLADGRWVPTFPNARYVMAKADVDYFARLKPEGINAVHSAAYYDSVLPVIEAGQADLIESAGPIDIELGQGLRLEGVCGHTPGSVMLHVNGGGRHALLSGDVIHHPIQLADPALAIHDEFDRALSESVRRTLIERLTDVDTLLLAAHFPAPTAGRIVSRRGSPIFQFAED